jgi:hypothetical protein
MDGSQGRKIGHESCQDVIKWLHGSLYLETKQALCDHVNNAVRTGIMGERTYRAGFLGALQFPSQAWSLEAKTTAHQIADQNVRVDGAPRLTAFRRTAHR